MILAQAKDSRSHSCEAAVPGATGQMSKTAFMCSIHRVTWKAQLTRARVMPCSCQHGKVAHHSNYYMHSSIDSMKTMHDCELYRARYAVWMQLLGAFIAFTYRHTRCIWSEVSRSPWSESLICTRNVTATAHAYDVAPPCMWHLCWNRLETPGEG